MIDSTILDRVLTALDSAGRKYRRGSTGYVAQCPAHDDHNPSLSVSNGTKGVVLKCQAGCETRDIVSALNLDWVDLFPVPAPGERQQPTVVAQYDYQAADGTVLFRKLRLFPKDFRVQHPNGAGWKWGLGNAPRVLYRLPQVLDAVREGRRVWIVEGEKDADRLVAIGEVATCNFDGASKDGQRPKWRDAYSDVLVGAHVMIIADNDEPGTTHAEAIASSLTGKATSVTIVRAKLDTPHADVSDHLAAGHTLAELIPLKPPPTPARRVALTLASEVTMRRTRWLWDHRIPLGGLTLLAGREGLGKSTLAVALAAMVTRGELPGEHYGTPGNVVYVHSEDARDYTITPRLEAAGADRSRVAFVDVLMADDTPTSIVLPLDTDLLGEQVSRFGAVLVVLDAATSTIDGRLDGDKDRQMRQALESIATNVGERTGAAVLGIVHFGKRDSGDTGKLILGSIAWSQVARSTIAVAQDADSGNLVITGSKANLSSTDVPSLAARVDEAIVATPEGPTSVSKVTWLGATDADARDLLDGGEGASERAELTEARGWLRDYLGQGRVKSGECKRAATAAGVSERTLQRARSKLKVQITSAGYPRVTYWSLPTHDDSGATCASKPRARAGEQGGTTTTTDSDLRKQGGTTVGTTSGTTSVGTTECANSGAIGTTPGPAFMPVVTVVPHAPLRAPARDPGGDAWVLAHLTRAPVTVARLVTELDATTGAVDAALTRLATAGLAQRHAGPPTAWSLPTPQEPT